MPKEIVCMKCQAYFSRKDKKNSINLSFGLLSRQWFYRYANSGSSNMHAYPNNEQCLPILDARFMPSDIGL